MSDNYTRYIVGGQEAGTLPGDDPFDAAWDQLRRDVEGELARRGLWDLKPSILGLPVANWQEAMDELLQIVFCYIFVDRLKNLRTKLRRSSHDNIDGIVVLQIRHCLTHLQRQQDPIGYRVYEVLHTALSRCVEAGQVKTDPPNARIDNSTVLRFARSTAAKGPSDLVERAHSWLETLLPDLMIARGRQVTQMIEQLRGLVVSLRQEGVRSFRFKDLVDPLKQETRRRWLAAWSEEGQPSDSPHHDVDLHGLHRCVSGKIDLEGKKKTREDLARTWTFLRATKPGLNGSQPSAVQVGQAVEVDRSRVPGLLATLKRMVAECLSAQGR